MQIGIRRRGGIGLRTCLKSMRPYGHESSNLSDATMNIEIKKLAELLVSMVIGSSQLEGECYLTKEDRAEMIRKTE